MVFAPLLVVNRDVELRKPALEELLVPLDLLRVLDHLLLALLGRGRNALRILRVIMPRVEQMTRHLPELFLKLQHFCIDMS